LVEKINSTEFKVNQIDCTQIIQAFCSQGRVEDALNILSYMDKYRINPSVIIYTLLLHACALAANEHIGRQVYNHIKAHRVDITPVLQSALLHMYAKCGLLSEAAAIFYKMDSPDLVTWNIIISAYAQHGFGDKVMELLNSMKQSGMKPTVITYTTVLKAFAEKMSLTKGKQLHEDIVNSKVNSDEQLESTLLNMYSKCGSLEEAVTVFKSMLKKNQVNVITWTTMLAAYVEHGHGKKVLELLDSMLEAGVKPNETTFLNILHGLSHAGLAEECLSCFKTMESQFHITPNIQHYNCVVGYIRCVSILILVDALGRVGKLDEAEKFISSMRTLAPDIITWKTFLAALSTRTVS
jgi:pentatricopeptide repeat protein